jgi:hypothetical protein
MIIFNTLDSNVVKILLKLVPFFVNISELEWGFVLQVPKDVYKEFIR